MTEHTQAESSEKVHTKNILSTPVAILIAGAIISLAILAHGVLAAGTSTTPTEQAIKIDQKLVSDTLEQPVLYRYFADEPHTEKVVFSEYSDTECPFCKNFHNTMRELMSNTDGSVAWVYNYFPLSFHTRAQKEAEAIECVREMSDSATAFHFIDIIFALTPANNGLPPETLTQIVKTMKLPTKKFTECLDSGKYADKVKSQIVDGQKRGVTGTPYTFVNVQKGSTSIEVGTINGAQPIEIAKSLLEEASKK